MAHEHKYAQNIPLAEIASIPGLDIRFQTKSIAVRRIELTIDKNTGKYWLTLESEDGVTKLGLVLDKA